MLFTEFLITVIVTYIIIIIINIFIIFIFIEAFIIIIIVLDDMRLPIGDKTMKRNLSNESCGEIRGGEGEKTLKLVGHSVWVKMRMTARMWAKVKVRTRVLVRVKQLDH